MIIKKEFSFVEEKRKQEKKVDNLINDERNLT